MWYRRLGKTDLNVSALCLGTVNYGTFLPDDQCMGQLDAFAAGGGNFLDSAHVYGDWTDGPRGKSEIVIGQWMQKNNCRGSMILATKGAHPRLHAMSASRVTPEDIRQDLRESLENLGTDHIDLYFLHRDDPRVPAGEIIDLMEGLKATGLIRSYGCSNWTLPRIREAAEYASRKKSGGLACNQLMWSLADVRKSAIADPTMIPMDAQTYAFHVKTSMSAMAYMAVAKGYFARRRAGEALDEKILALYGGRSNDAIYDRLLQYEREGGSNIMALSLQYLMAHPFDSVPIASFDDASQLQSGLEACAARPDSAAVQALHRMKTFLADEK